MPLGHGSEDHWHPILHMSRMVLMASIDERRRGLLFGILASISKTQRANALRAETDDMDIGPFLYTCLIVNLTIDKRLRLNMQFSCHASFSRVRAKRHLELSGTLSEKRGRRSRVTMPPSGTGPRAEGPSGAVGAQGPRRCEALCLSLFRSCSLWYQIPQRNFRRSVSWMQATQSEHCASCS